MDDLSKHSTTRSVDYWLNAEKQPMTPSEIMTLIERESCKPDTIEGQADEVFFFASMAVEQLQKIGGLHAMNNLAILADKIRYYERKIVAELLEEKNE